MQILVRGFFILLLISFIRCGGSDSRDTVTLRVPVTVDEVRRGDIASYISLTGTLLSAEEMPIIAEVGGEFSFHLNGDNPFRKGDVVRKGQLIGEVANEDYVLSVRLESKRLAKEHAARDLEEKRKLGEMGGVPPREIEAAERNKVDAELSYKAALLDLEKLKIRAPMDGILADLEPFADGQKIPNGAEVGRIMNYRVVRCELNVTNDEIGKVRLGQEVLVTNFAYEEEYFTGHVSKISPTIDPLTRTFQVEVEIDNPEARLRPGMFVRADIVVTRHRNVITIPKHVIVTRNNRDVVFVVEEQVAKMREVTVGLQDAEFAEIVDGLDENERLVIRGYETLKDNTKVRISR